MITFTVTNIILLFEKSTTTSESQSTMGILVICKTESGLLEFKISIIIM